MAGTGGDAAAGSGDSAQISHIAGEAEMGEVTPTSGNHDTSNISQKMECKVSQIFSVLLWTLLSIAMIIIGSMHVDNCPIEPKIPIYLIVAGVFHLLAFSLIPLKMVGEKLAYTIESVLGVFSFCWFIAGSVWVFRIYQENPRRCNDLCYKFAFGILIFEYIFLALVVAGVCCVCFCAGVLVASSSDTPGTNISPEDEEALK
ncbi:transmembrane protein 272-like isoform X1 [Anomaloglossus baeobatrachus]|uniref:transmembrane protein 272-like isoform X1 n=2 Tax=Anomaloglossus baeobatrachus TaxID=238106 RepID=UPI003F50A794